MEKITETPNKIREIRLRKGLTIAELASRIPKMTASCLSKMETGKRSVSIKSALKIARELDVTAEELGITYNLPNNIRKLRCEKGLTIKELAYLIEPKMDANNLSRLETGTLRLTMKTASRIARALGVTPEYLQKPCICNEIAR